MKDTYGSTGESHFKVLKIIGQRMRERREAIELTQADLASALQMDRAHIGQFERGQVNISAAALMRIGALLGVDWATVIPKSTELARIFGRPDSLG